MGAVVVKQRLTTKVRNRQAERIMSWFRLTLWLKIVIYYLSLSPVAYWCLRKYYRCCCCYGWIMDQVWSFFNTASTKSCKIASGIMISKCKISRSCIWWKGFLHHLTFGDKNFARRLIPWGHYTAGAKKNSHPGYTSLYWVSAMSVHYFSSCIA